MNRREFIGVVATVPMIGAVVEPTMAGIVEDFGKRITMNPVRDMAYGTIMIYGRMALTGKQLAEIRDDRAWKDLIDSQCENLKQSMYEYVKKVARREPEAIEHLAPEGALKINPMRKIGGRYV